MISKKDSQKIPFSLFTVRQQISSHVCAALCNKDLTSLVFALPCPCSSSSNTLVYANALYAYPFPRHFPHHHWYRYHYWTRQAGGKYNTLE
jgi:hypothetical protein